MQTCRLQSLHHYRTNTINGKSIQFKIHLRLFDDYRLRFANLRLNRTLDKLFVSQVKMPNAVRTKIAPVAVHLLFKLSCPRIKEPLNRTHGKALIAQSEPAPYQDLRRRGAE